MPAYLQQVTPGSPGDRIDLSETAEVLVGRANDCDIQVDDLHCSRKHASLYHVADKGWHIKDHSSRHGTYINGSTIDEVVLQSGDRLNLGQLTFYFFEHDADKGLQLPVEKQKRKTGSFRTTMTLRVDADRYLQTGLVTTDRDRTSRDLALLYESASKIACCDETPELLSVLLDAVSQGTNVESGAVLLTQDEGDWTLELIRQISPEAIQHFLAYTDFTETAVATGEASVTTNLRCPPVDDFTLAEQIDSVDSVLCAPMTSPQGTLGVVHLYCRAGERPFTEEDIQLVLALATHAGTALESLRVRENLERQNQALRANLEHTIIGTSQSIQQVKEVIARSATVNSTVLVRGESGTGKELVARAIHEGSDRCDGPLVTLNCAAVPEQLLESELFGHERGAFTGADRDKPGKFELAEGGSIFLDEVGDMPLTSQAKLLRVIESREYQRVGGVRDRKTDVRLIAATNRQLEEAVRDGDFREDLYYRLTPIQIFLPSLRERKEDIALLVKHFLNLLQNQTGRHCNGLSLQAEQLVMAYDWPGNVRQLRNSIERAIVMCQTDQIMPEDLGIGPVTPPAPSSVPTPEVRLVSMAECERQHILAVYEALDSNKQQTAKTLGIHRSTLYSKLREYGIDV